MQHSQPPENVKKNMDMISNKIKHQVRPNYNSFKHLLEKLTHGSADGDYDSANNGTKKKPS